jgi:hypothetical protein
MVANTLKREELYFTRLVASIKKHVLIEDWEEGEDRLPPDIRVEKWLQVCVICSKEEG